MGEEIKNCVKPGSGPVFLWLRQLRFLVAADAFFRLLWLRFPVAAACCNCVGHRRQFFQFIHNNFWQKSLASDILYVFDLYINCCQVQIV